MINESTLPAAVTVSFVIPAWNEERRLARCLASISGQILPSGVGAIEMIVVDNESTDGTAAVAVQGGARVCPVKPGRASRARNAGARLATGQWLAFVDADCELAPNWLEVCSRHFQYAQTVAVGAAMRQPVQGASWVEQSWYALSTARAPREATDVRWLPTFNLLVRRRDFDDVGGFNEDLVTCEDCDLGYRLAARGRLVFEPGSTAAHHGESQTLLQLFQREAWRSQGNLSVARKRVGDWRNWISLALPPASALGLVLAVILAVAAVRLGGVFWPWSLAALAVFALPFAVVLSRVVRRAPTAMLPSILVVFGTYLAARTAGLFLAVPRVARDVG